MDVENEEIGEGKDDSELSGQGGRIPSLLKEMRQARSDLFAEK